MKYTTLLLLFGCHATRSFQAIQLATRAKNPLADTEDMQDFLLRPIHWPQIVASSDSVGSSTMDVRQPIKPGQSVDEFFGLGLLSVSWTCRQVQKGGFLVESPSGLSGIAKNCSMDFAISDNEVTLTMGYTPESFLAILVTPVLIVDNWIALNVLLQAATDRTPLNSFRRLMGSLYGIAGLTHAADLALGEVTLFTSFGLPPFGDLSVEAKAYAVLWCALGPLSYIASQRKGWMADLGLVIYGFVEAFGAFLSGNQEATTNAIGVQFVVAAAWFYSQQKQNARISANA